MKKAVLSWIAWHYDFTQGELPINTVGPNFDLHKYFFKDHEKHVLLSPEDEDGTKGKTFFTALKAAYPDRQIELKCLDVQDIFDYQELKVKAGQVLAELRDYEVDILFSNGTTPMRTVWVLLHLEENGVRTRLIQGKDREMANGKARFPEIKLDKTLFPYRVAVKEEEFKPAGKQPLILPVLEPVYEQAAYIAGEDAITTLIQGASGTGKEFLARYIHAHSPRKNQPFIPVNCAAMGNDLLESRLFGHRKGAFTDANEDRKGLFEEAHGGTLFLDEIGDITPYMQQSLLRVLQEKEIQRVGESKSRKVNVRVIAATNKDLWACCESGQYRWDLFYRLSVTSLFLPSLGEYTRAEKNTLIQHFLKEKARSYRKSVLRLAPAVREALLTYDFPGNIRELEHLVISCYFATQGSTIEIVNLPRHFRYRHALRSLTLESAKADHIRKVLPLFDYNLAQTARALEIAPNTLKKIMREHGIPFSRAEQSSSPQIQGRQPS